MLSIATDKASTSADLSYQMDNLSAGFCPTSALFPTVPKPCAEALRGFVLRPDGWHLALEWDESTSQEQFEQISKYPAFVQREFQRRNVPMDQYATVNWSTEYTWSLSPQGVVEIRQPRTEWNGFVRLQQGQPDEREVDWVRVEQHPGRVKRVDLSKG